MSIRIILLNNKVSPNSYVEGKVICVIKFKKDIRGIRLKLRGREHTAWQKTERHYDSQEKRHRSRTVHYSGDNKFLDVVQNLRGGGKIEAGQYEFPFKFFLPKDLPSSYNGSHGSIKYYLKANVDIAMGLDFEDEKTFTLFSPIDFNELAVQLNPIQYQDEKYLYCCCCASDPITMIADLEKEAFVLGEKIAVKLKITNMSNTSIEHVKVEVKRTTEEKCTSPKTDHKKETDVIISSGDNGVGAHGERDYLFELQIPQNLELPNFRQCTLFRQWFTLKIEAVIPGCHSNMTIKLDISLGHIPVARQENRPHSTIITTGLPSYAELSPYPLTVPPSNIPSIGFQLPPSNNMTISIPAPGNQTNLPPSYASATSAPPYPPSVPNNPNSSMVNPPNQPYSRNTAPNAPSDTSAPSAPTKADLANNEDFVMLNG